MSQVPDANCPICTGDVKDVARAESVCERHQDYLVTPCWFCGLAIFSEVVGVACPECTVSYGIK